MFRPENNNHTRNHSDIQPSPKTTTMHPNSGNASIVPPSTAVPPTHTTFDQSPPQSRPNPHHFYRHNHSVDTEDPTNNSAIYMPRSPMKMETQHPHQAHNTSIQLSSTQATADITGGPSISTTNNQAGHTTSLPKIK